jgi:hypothetical protein
MLRRHSVDFNILTTVHAANGDRPLEVYRFMRDEVKAEFIQFIPIVEKDESGRVTDWSVKPEQFGRFLISIFDEWVKKDVGKVFVQIFDASLAAWTGPSRASASWLRHAALLWLLSTTATSTPATTSWTRSTFLETSSRRTWDVWHHLRSRGALAQSSSTPAQCLPQMRGQVRLQWRVSQEPVYEDS